MQRSKLFLILSISLIIIAWGINNGYAQVNVKIADVKTTKDTVLVPILVSDLSNYGVISYQFELNFDSLVINAIGVSAERTLTAKWGNAVANIDSAGKMIVGAFGVSELSAGDTLLNLVFEVVAEPGDSTAIRFETFKFNNDDPKTSVQDGSLKIVLPTGIRNRNFLSIPKQMKLLKNYPEPFQNQTRILVQLNQPGQIQVEIFNVLGQRIKQYEKIFMNTGSISIAWNTTTSEGMRVPPGVYFCVLKQENKIIDVDRMILIK